MSTGRYARVQAGEKVTDESGEVASKEVRRLGHSVTLRKLVSDDVGMIGEVVREFLTGEGDVLVFLGGTGVSKTDVTIETVRPHFEKELEGFGELLRSSSFRRVGAAAMLTRATAGVVDGKLILCIPGSPDAARVALRTFGGEIPHALFVARS